MKGYNPGTDPQGLLIDSLTDTEIFGLPEKWQTPLPPQTPLWKRRVMRYLDALSYDLAGIKEEINARLNDLVSPNLKQVRQSWRRWKTR